MNKKTKGILTVTAGAALLASGTTFAIWHDAAALDNDTLTTGQLSIDASGFDWLLTNSFSGLVIQGANAVAIGEGVEIDPDTFLLSPGDELTGTADVDITLIGDTLFAQLAIGGSPVQGEYASFEINGEGWVELTNGPLEARVSVDGLPADLSGWTDGILDQRFTDAEGALPIEITVEVRFPTYTDGMGPEIVNEDEDNRWGTDGQNASGSFGVSDLELTLTQVGNVS